MDVEKLIHCLQCCSKVDAHNIGCDDCGLEYCGPECQQLCGTAATALSTLQAENAQLRAYLEYEREHANAYYEECGQWEAENTQLKEKLETIKQERDAAVEAVKNMAEYIVCAGRVDYYLCDEISQEHHLKYQPKNDGNYDNEPCYKCIADWFLQGHKWQENCW